MPQPRVKLLDIDDYEITGHNEEHMVIKTPAAAKYHTGDVLYGVPFHVCPTIDRHDVVHVIRNKTFTETWNIEARRRKLVF
jgi:D-serine deaminase-like pyridoxal phosphate-dependent protein